MILTDILQYSNYVWYVNGWLLSSVYGFVDLTVIGCSGTMYSLAARLEQVTVTV